jgi:hypothetical protein
MAAPLIPLCPLGCEQLPFYGNRESTAMPAQREASAQALAVLNCHYETFYKAKGFADKVEHPVPCDTRAWSQILVSVLTGQKGRARKKGSDLADGSDVKAANCWSAIDTPRFNGAIPAGRKSKTSKKAPDVSALDDIPFIYFVLWDEMGEKKVPRCRVWCVQPKADKVFRAVCQKWYQRRVNKTIKSDNFQLHPPRNIDTDVITNECGNISLPLLFCASRKSDAFEVATHNPDVILNGQCRLVT